MHASTHTHARTHARTHTHTHTHARTIRVRVLGCKPLATFVRPTEINTTQYNEEQNFILPWSGSSASVALIQDKPDPQDSILQCLVAKVPICHVISKKSKYFTDILLNKHTWLIKPHSVLHANICYIVGNTKVRTMPNQLWSSQMYYDLGPNQLWSSQTYSTPSMK